MSTIAVTTIAVTSVPATSGYEPWMDDWRLPPVSTPSPGSLGRATPRARGAGRPRARAVSRSSSRSSDGDDSGGSSDGESEPPGAERVGRRFCAAQNCANEVVGRADRLTCSPACKRRRSRQEGKEEQAILAQRDAEQRVAQLPQREVPPDPLEGVDPAILWCLYGNTGLRVAA